MGKIYDSIDARLEQWIGQQQMFFVATAPREGGHVNLSPKGPIESLCVLDAHTVAYLDLVGSGIETVAHLRQNGRICLMLCAFQGPPRIVRLHGHGEALRSGSDEFAALAERFDRDALPAAERASRSLIRIDVERIADSCGFDVPLMEYRGRRPQRMAWVETKIAQGGETALAEYVQARNAVSIDGLPGI
jgi:Pyridoxamine 5'-phosphate oxidase